MALSKGCQELVEELLLAAPGAASAWSETLAFWEGEIEGDFNALSPFADHCVERAQAGRLAELAAFFAVCERGLEKQDAALEELIIIGFSKACRTSRLAALSPTPPSSRCLAREACKPGGTWSVLGDSRRALAFPISRQSARKKLLFGS